MKFYQNKQFQMLKNVAYVLKKDKTMLAARVPALKEIIEDFVEWMDESFVVQSGDKNVVKRTTLQKQDIRHGLVNCLVKLLGVLRAHHYTSRSTAVEVNGQDSMKVPGGRKVI